MKKFIALAVAGVVSTLAAGAAFAPSAAFAVNDPSVSYSASTICPGETVTFSANGVSDGSQVTLTLPQTFLLTFNGASLPATNTAYTGQYAYDQIVARVGGNDGDVVVSIDDESNIVAQTTLTVLPECPPPTLPDTGIDTVAYAAAGGFAAVAAFAGVMIVAGRRRQS